MPFETKYQSKPVDENGFVDYTKEENEVWKELYNRQINVIENRAFSEFIDGLHLLNLTSEKIPQIPDINARLMDHTGWSVEAVPALIPNDQFYNLLANKKFPAATFIRRRDELDYLQEPDIFHEFFGHCPLITDQVYADFMELYGKIAEKANDAQLAMLGRLYWFTIEFGLINTEQGIRVYGGGILSSKEETIYALESETPERREFKPLDILRTPFRIDILQTVYYVIDDLQQLYTTLDQDILSLIQQAQELGDFTPTFPGDGTYY